LYIKNIKRAEFVADAVITAIIKTAVLTTALIIINRAGGDKNNNRNNNKNKKNKENKKNRDKKKKLRCVCAVLTYYPWVVYY